MMSIRLRRRWNSANMHKPQPQVVTSNGEYLAKSMITMVADAVVPRAHSTDIESNLELKMAATSPKDSVSRLSRMKFKGDLRLAESMHTRMKKIVRPAKEATMA